MNFDLLNLSLCFQDVQFIKKHKYSQFEKQINKRWYLMKQ